MTLPLTEKMQKELMATFQKELEEHLKTLNNGLLALEKNPLPDERNDLLMGIFRAAHSIKGSSRFVNLREIEIIAHRMESALDIIRKDCYPLTTHQINIFLKAVDMIGLVMDFHIKGEHISEESLKATLDDLDRIMNMEISPDLSESPPDPAFKSKTPDNETLSQAIKQSEMSSQKIEQQRPLTARPISTDDTIRIATTKLDALMGSLGELMVVRMRTEQFLEQTKALQQRTVRWQENWRKARPYYRRIKTNKAYKQEVDLAHLIDFIEGNERELHEISSELNKLIGKLKNDNNYLNLVTDDLQIGIRNARMLPVGTLFDMFPRIVRDLAHDFGKDIILEMSGQETEVDRQALELIKDPMFHIIRNAIDHGIEPPDERLSKGKTRYGTIKICAEQRGSNMAITVSDDGRGIDLEAVRRAAVEHGLMPPDKAEALKDGETVELIFFSGLSTARQVTDISGRGVGMDVVRENLEQMHGLIQVETVYGAGTTFTLILPLTFATSQVVFVRVAGEILAIPMMNVERMLYLDLKQIGNIDGRPAIYTNGHSLPLFNLASILELRDSEHPLEQDAKIPVVVLSVVEKRVALIVDAFLSTQQVVIKSLGKQLRRVRNIAGVTILGDGRLVTVLNVADILKSIHTGQITCKSLPVVKRETRRINIMVIDDSITTRTLEKHILENAGYSVVSFVDGQEAWEYIQGRESDLPDLIVSDIDMPRMDGFALTKAVKGDKRYAHLPVVLVTSLESPRDRLEGMEAGADAYIVKSSFDQQELLEAIRRFIR